MKKVLTLFLILTAVMQAQEYNLDTAVKTALKNNNEINKINKNIEIKELDYKKTKKSRLPKLSYSGSLTKLSDKVSLLYGVELMPYTLEDSDIMYSNKLVLTQPIYTGGALTNGIKIKELSKDIEVLNLDSKKREIKLEVSKNYLEILKLEKTRKVLKASLDEMEDIYGNLEANYELGLVQKKPLLDIKYRMTDIKSSIISLENGIELKKMNLKSLMKVEEDNFAIKDIEMPRVDIESISLKSDMKYALDNKDIIKTLELGQEITKANEKIKKSDMLPKVYFNVNYELYGQNYGYSVENSWNASLSVSMDVFDFGAARDGIKQAKKEVEERELDRDIAEDRIELAVNSAYYRMKKYGDLIEVKKEALESAKENYRIEKEKFDLMLNTSTDLLGAENNMTKVEAELINAQIDMYISYLQYNYLIEREAL